MNAKKRVAPLVLASVLLAGTSLPVLAQTEILVWDQFTDEGSNRAADAVYAAFMAKHPEITVKREVYSYDQIRTIARTALESGTGPDVIYHEVGPGNAGVLARANLIISLEDYSAQFGWHDRLQPAAIEEGNLDGQLYGLGLEFEFFGTYYNIDELEALGLAPPSNLEEVLAFCETAAAAGKIPFVFSVNPGWQAYHLISAGVYDFMGAEKADALLFDREGTWTDPAVVEAVRTLFVDMREAGCWPDDVAALLQDDAAALFYAGDALAWPTGTWQVGRVADNMPDANVALLAFPSLGGDGSAYLPTGVGSAYYISAKSESPDEAALLLDYIFSEEAAKVWVEEAGFIPPVAFDVTTMDASPLFLSALTTISTAGKTEGEAVRVGPYINHFVSETFVNLLRSGSQAVITGVQTPEEFAAELQNSVGN